MRTGTRIAAFVVALATVFAVSLWIGRAVAPDDGATAEHAAPTPSSDESNASPSTHGGYSLDLTESVFPADAETMLGFRVVDGSGAPVTRYDESHEKLLHLIVIRNDLTAFQHLHPTLDDSAIWRVPVNLSRAGDYRVFADFVPTDGPAQTLSANVHVAGEYDPRPLPPVRTVSEVGGYAVTLNGAPEAGEASTLTLSVARDGKPVGDLQPYLGAFGHLVALRAADLAYLHVHPMGEPGDRVTAAGPEIMFHTSFPSPGEYRLFFEFQHGGVVRSADFTVSVEGTGQTSSTTGENSDGGHGH